MTKADPKLLDYLPDRDMLVVQRRFLLDAHDKQRAIARERQKLPAESAETRDAAPAPLARRTAPIAQSWPAKQPNGLQESESQVEKAGEPQHELPPMLYSFESVYRYTRGINDISNSGMGYGEVTRETRWSCTGGTLLRVELAMRRTRTGRQEIERAPKRSPR